MYFKLGLETAPVLGCLLLLASTCVPGSVIRDGIVGSEGVRPYDIMTLFISFVSPKYNSLSFFLVPLTAYKTSQYLLTETGTLHHILIVENGTDPRPTYLSRLTAPVSSST